MNGTLKRAGVLAFPDAHCIPRAVLLMQGQGQGRTGRQQHGSASNSNQGSPIHASSSADRNGHKTRQTAAVDVSHALNTGRSLPHPAAVLLQ